MDGNLFAEITECTKRFEALRAQPNFIFSDVNSHHENQRGENVQAMAIPNQIAEVSVDTTYSISVDSAGKNIDVSVLKAGYITYEIAVVRSSDSERHSVMRRFKEIMTFYNEVKQLNFIHSKYDLLLNKAFYPSTFFSYFFFLCLDFEHRCFDKDEQSCSVSKE
jgi:hypothetical protein